MRHQHALGWDLQKDFNNNEYISTVDIKKPTTKKLFQFNFHFVKCASLVLYKII